MRRIKMDYSNSLHDSCSTVSLSTACGIQDYYSVL